MNDFEKARKEIGEYISKRNYTWTVDEIVSEYIKKSLGWYVSHTAEDCIKHCTIALDIMALEALREKAERENPKPVSAEQAKYEQAIGQMERCYSGCAVMNSENREFVDFVINALRTQSERSNPQPLTLDELKERVGKWIWQQSLTGHFSGWKMLEAHLANNPGDYHYGERWLAYDHEPKEAR